MKMRKILSVLLVFAMVFSSLGITAFASDEVATVSTMEELVKAVSENSTITATAVLTVEEGTEISLDLSGCTVNMGAYYIENKGTLSLSNGTLIANDSGNATNGAPILNKGSLTVEKTSVTGVIAAIRNESGNTVINSGTFTVTNTNGVSTNHIVRVKGGTVEINDGKFTGNNTSNQGGGCIILSWTGGSAVINGGTFDNFYGYDGIFGSTIDAKPNVTITGGTFTNIVVEGTSVADCLKNYLADGCVVDANGKVIKYTAYIGETGYETVQAAINAAKDGETVNIGAGEFEPISISSKNITIEGTVGENGELLTTIKGGNPAITGHSFNGTIKDIKIVDAFKVMYAEPAGNVAVDNVYVTGATYGFHLVAYSSGLTWKIENSYMDLSWANSFGVYGDGYADIIIKGNEFISTAPYYPDYGAIHVNSFLPSVTVEENIFRKNARIYIDAEAVTDTSKISISKNYHEDGVENAFADDAEGVKTKIASYYKNVDEDGNLTELVILPNGDDFTGYTNETSIWGEVWGNATESFVIKILDAEGNVMGTTSLNNIDGIIDGDVKVTWNIKLDAESNTDEYWTMSWTTAPSATNVPAKVELWVDGTRVSGGNVVLNSPDDLYPVFAAKTDDNGKILSYIRRLYKDDASVALTSAIAEGGNIVLLRDITLDTAVTVPEGVSAALNLNGKTIGVSTTFEGRPIKNYGTLTVSGNGTIDASVSEKGYGAIDNYGTLTVTDGTFKGNPAGDGGTIRARENSVTTLNGGTYYGAPRAVSGGATSKVDINGGTFHGVNGYRVYTIFSDGVMTINNGSFDGYHGVVASDAGRVTVNDGSFTLYGYEGSNHVLYIGKDGASIVVKDGTFDGESKYDAPNDGSTALWSYGVAEIYGGSFNGYHSDLCADEDGTISVMGGTFADDVSAYCAEGYVCEKNSDGTYEVTPELPTAGFLRSFWVVNMPIITVEDSNGNEVECYQLGLFAGIDDYTKYQTAGFDITYGSNTGDLKTKSLYTSITGNNQTVTAEQLGERANRIFGKIAWIPTSKFNPDTDKISFTPYVINNDGSKTCGEIRNLETFSYQKGETK